MKISDNFAITCKPIRCYAMDATSGALIHWMSLGISRGKYNLRFGREADTAYATEREAWEQVARRESNYFAMMQGNGLVTAGLAQRAQLILDSSDLDWEQRQQEMKEKLVSYFLKIADGMGATIMAKKMTAGQLSHSSPLSVWTVKAKVGLPHLGKPEALRCDFIPSPVNENGWGVNVILSTATPEVYVRNQELITEALVSPGFDRCDVRQGSWLLA